MLDPTIESPAAPPADMDIATTTLPDAPTRVLVEQDLLVEDLSIDGMCGVY